MKKGGYQIIDFKGANLTADGVKVPGIYATLEGNYGKPTLAAGLVTDGTERPDCYVNFVGGDNAAYTGAIAGVGTLTIADTDTVTFTAAG